MSPVSHKPINLSSPARRFRAGLGHTMLSFSLEYGVNYDTLRSVESGVTPRFGSSVVKAYIRAGADVEKLEAEHLKWRNK